MSKDITPQSVELSLPAAQVRLKLKEMLEQYTGEKSVVREELNRAAGTTDEHDKPFRRFRDDLKRNIKFLGGVLERGNFSRAVEHIQGAATQENFKMALDIMAEGSGDLFDGVPAHSYARMCLEAQIESYEEQLVYLEKTHGEWLQLDGITPRTENARTRIAATIGRLISER